ncbi:flagellar biosynthetic protein FliR [Derxia gummosa]|uniref:Flagellar biosynthetic protein FliR n=1 Tax=Derxia gummosa DSM 723 TaxID=1121388 RepID=A0A8B6X686_9BURK|nr:flagellar biosynthetic protein FliR [Derxia gummosa]
MVSFSFEQVWNLLVQFWWPFVRLLALFGTAPVLSHRSIPTRFRVLGALVLAIVLAPAIPDAATVSNGGALENVGTLLRQLMVGFVIGFSMRLVFAAVEYAGDLAGLQMGLSFATFVDPQNARQTPLLGSFLSLFATMLFLSADGHLMLIAQLAESFRVIPVLGPVTAGFDLLGIASWGSQLFTIGFNLALPVIVAILVCNMALGVMARVAPQLSIFNVGFAVTLLVGLFIVAMMLPLLGAPLDRLFNDPLWTRVR